MILRSSPLNTKGVTGQHKSPFAAHQETPLLSEFAISGLGGSWSRMVILL